jgi:uncharacterized protein YecE (DUF72 family)
VTSRAGSIRIGCSGWSYPHWRRRFYPEHLREAQWFAHYAESFDTVEINNSFYRLPTARAVAQWEAQAPQGFLYAVKVNRFITHMKKLKDPQQPLAQFVGRMRGLGMHLGPLLYQLPPHWRCDLARLREFLAILPADLVHVFEFRDASWLSDAVFSLLDHYTASLCVHDMSGIEVPRVAVGRVAYMRFHGTGVWYSGAYSDSTLRACATWLRTQAAAGRPGFAYFNNDAEAQAVRDAQHLLRLLRNH